MSTISIPVEKVWVNSLLICGTEFRMPLLSWVCHAVIIYFKALFNRYLFFSLGCYRLKYHVADGPPSNKIIKKINSCYSIGA